MLASVNEGMLLLSLSRVLSEVKVMSGSSLFVTHMQCSSIQHEPPDEGLLSWSVHPMVAEGPMKPGKSERPVVLITTVDIGGGKSDKIEIRKGDEPSDAARAFCQKHGLPDSVVGPLTMHILDNLKKAGKKLEQESLKVHTHA